MRAFSGLAAAAVIALLTMMSGAIASAAERITAYHSDVDVAENGDMIVKETISIVAEGIQIRRGIVRDFPLTMVDGDRRTVRVGFDLLSVKRDGQDEPYHTEMIDRGIRIYTGAEDKFLSLGQHVYQLTYKVDRMIRYFPDHDEIYWNVTGTGWQFSIAQASARVSLPSDEVTKTAVYTGPFGSTASRASVQIDGNRADFVTTRALGPNEGLTVVVAAPKGVIAPPSDAQLRAWWLRDHMADIVAVAGLILISLYYVFFWIRVGRDPARGTVVPRWDPPEGLSPALVNYVDNKGFNGAGWPAFSANALELAVKGYVTFRDVGSTITVTRTDKPLPRSLPAGESSILSAIGASGESLVISSSNGERVQKAGQKFREAIQSEHRGKYYRSNIGYTIGGLFLSVILVIAVVILGDVDADITGFIFASVVMAAFVGIFSARLGLRLRHGAPLRHKIAAVIIGGFVGFVLVSVFAAIMTAILEQLTADDHWLVIIAVSGIVIANVIFFFLMGAPTPLGARLMDHIDGLRLYLTVAEKDRMNMAGAPTMSPQHFETLLPYAVALGVEKPWSDAFQTWLSTAAAASVAASYSPAWYHGHSGSFGDGIGGFSSSMASTIASTLPAPVSSTSSGFSGSGGGFSSGGGGFSGGGGGGGGGGGW